MPCCWPRRGRAALDEPAGADEAEPRRLAPALVPRRPARDPRQAAARRGGRAPDGSVIPVLTHVGADADDASSKDNCPACQQRDGIRFLGSAVATQLSVALSTLFGSTNLDAVGEEDPGLHRQRPGRGAPGRLRAEPVAQPHGPLDAARRRRRRRPPASTCSPSGSSSRPGTTRPALPRPAARPRRQGGVPPVLGGQDAVARSRRAVRKPGRASGSPSTPSSSSACSPGSAGPWR